MASVPWHLCGEWILSFLAVPDMVLGGGLCRAQTGSESMWHGLACHLGVSGLPNSKVRRWKALRSVSVCPRGAFVKRLVEQRRAKSTRDHHRLVSLWGLIRAGEVRAAKLRHLLLPGRDAPLLARGMDPNARSSEFNAGNPAANMCAMHGRLRTLRALQAQGARLTVRDDGNMTSLAYASWAGEPQMVAHILATVGAAGGGGGGSGGGSGNGSGGGDSGDVGSGGGGSSDQGSDGGAAEEVEGRGGGDAGEGAITDAAAAGPLVGTTPMWVDMLTSKGIPARTSMCGVKTPQTALNWAKLQGAVQPAGTKRAQDYAKCARLIQRCTAGACAHAWHLPATPPATTGQGTA
jgi:uncharacterized membrane protein YgcG